MVERRAALLTLGGVVGASMIACSLITDLGDLGPNADATPPDGSSDASSGDALGDVAPNLCVDAGPQVWTTIAPGPLPGRDQAAIFWTGTDYLVFGGTEWGTATNAEVDPDGAAPAVPDGGYPLGCGIGAVGYTCSDGARYNPTTDAWTRISNVGAPPPLRWDMSWAFGGGKLFTFGGHGTSGAWIYDLASDSWSTITAPNPPTPRAYHASYYVNGQFFVWGGESLDAPDASAPFGTPLSSGALYDPVKDAWYPINPSTFAGTAYYATASSDTQFFVWGGTTDAAPWNNVVVNVTNAGAIYDYATNEWKPTSTTNAPDPRLYAGAVWTGSKFVVYGGNGANKNFSYNNGGIYDPATDTWTAMSMTNGPAEGISANTMVWTGSKVLVWGYPPNVDGGHVVAAGAIFDPVANVWDGPITATNAPTFADNLTAGNENPWNGHQLLMWGNELDDAGVYTLPTSGALYTPPCP